MSNIDKITAEYRRKGLSEEVFKAEFLWPIINFLYCSYATKKVREMEIPKTRLMATVVSFLIADLREDLQDQYRVPDFHYSRLSKLLKCILFVQDINKSTRSSEVLGENARYILRDFLGRPIFTGSSEEGLAIYGNESMFRSENYDELSYKLNHDIDVMYESDKMVAHELGSYTTPVEKNWVLNVLMRPGRKAGYVTLQKCIPKDIFDKIGSTEEINGKIVELCPQPLEYVGQDKLVFCYLQTVAFLKDCEKRIKLRDCDCLSVYQEGVGGKDPNRYGDLCVACSRASLKEIYRGKDKSPTKVWSDIIRIQGPSVHEITIIENESTPSKSRAPMNEAEAKEHWKKVLGIHRTKSSAKNERRLPTVEPQLNDIFSSSGRKMIFVDHVPAIKCARWPSAAWEFTVRERPSGWPSDDLVKQIVEKGCHVIPKGIKAPPNTKSKQAFASVFNSHDFMEWRLSFSAAEKILTASLNEVQVKCYMLLKMLHEKIKEQNNSAFSRDYKEGLGFDPIYPDSYFLKTTFFWACEKIPLSEWKDDNLGLCFIRVLDQLILFMENRTVPNYFIPSNNIIPVHYIDFTFVPLCDTLLYSSFYWEYIGKSSEFLFESLQKIVWSSLWSMSKKKPPGSTPRDLKRIMRAMYVEDFDPWEVEEEEETDSEDDHRERVRQGKQSSEKATDDVVLLHDSVPNDDHLKSSCSKNGEASEKTGNDTDARSTPVQWPCKLDKVLAQIFAAISKFIYTHGNTYGLGVNTDRAAFYEEEARKLLPAGCSLRDIEEYEYELSDSSDDSDYTEDSDESEVD